MECDIIFTSVEILYVKLLGGKTMKKIISIIAAIAMIALMSVSAFAASDSTANANEILKFLKDYSYTTSDGATTISITSDQYNKIENYLLAYAAENEISDADVADVKSTVNTVATKYGDEIVKNKDLSKLPTDAYNEISKLASDLLAKFDLKYTISNGNIVVTTISTGEPAFSFSKVVVGGVLGTTSNGTPIKPTGTGINATAAISAAAVITVIAAGCAVIIFRRKVTD